MKLKKKGMLQSQTSKQLLPIRPLLTSLDDPCLQCHCYPIYVSYSLWPPICCWCRLLSLAIYFLLLGLLSSIRYCMNTNQFFILKCSFSCAEIIRVSGMIPNQGFGDFDRLQHRSPSPMASSNLMSSVTGTGLGGWNGLPQEVITFS